VSRKVVLDQTAHNPVPTAYAAIELRRHHATRQGPAQRLPIRGGASSDLVLRLRTATHGGERLLVCCEAGYDGFWLARSLKTEKIDCRVSIAPVCRDAAVTLVSHLAVFISER
jgi:hypothetical protein